eukprot:364549_1
MVFVGAYILFAPFVGQVADSFAKGRVMMFANGLKLLGAASICFGINPFLGYTLVGVGAAAYSPAKYGILGELTTGSKLVKANGLMEASTIAAILLGSVAGGVLADWHVLVALAACALAYGGAVVANIYIPKLAAARPGQSWNLINMTRSFLNACTSLWRNGETRFSLVGTSLFWGAGVTLRFLLVLWVPVALGITDNATPTYLNAMVAIGIVVGAGAAAKLVTLETVSRCMPAGILIGVVVLIFSLQHELLPAYALLMLIGVMGGFFVVPLNALLQERGKKSVGAGNAIAVQNLGENSAMLLMLKCCRLRPFALVFQCLCLLCQTVVLQAAFDIINATPLTGRERGDKRFSFFWRLLAVNICQPAHGVSVAAVHTQGLLIITFGGGII